jgi:hypothetical protein
MLEDAGKEEYLDLIEAECSNAIEAFKQANGFLLRGLMLEKGKYVPGKLYSTGPRSPKDTDILMQNMVDDVLKLAGFKALRGNSIFCSGDYEQAEGYGPPVYVIFPKDGFQITWSTRYKDFFVDFSSIRKDPTSFLVNPSTDLFIGQSVHTNKATYSHLANLKNALSAKDNLEGFIDAIIFRIDLLTEAMSLNDKMNAETALKSLLKLHQEYVQKTSDDSPFTSSAVYTRLFKEIQDWIDSPPPELNARTVRKTILKHGFQKDNLAEAIRAGNEIYLHGQYYAFDMATYGETLERLIQEW